MHGHLDLHRNNMCTLDHGPAFRNVSKLTSYSEEAEEESV